MDSIKITFLIILAFSFILSTSSAVQGQDLNNISANSILENISKGNDINISDSVIRGKLNLSELNTTKLKTEYIVIPEILGGEFKDRDHTIIENKITIKNSVFENDVDFSYIKFLKPVDFSGSNFSKKANFEAVIISSPVDFTKVNFYDEVFFNFSRFDGPVNFNGAHFYGFAYFNRLKFESFVVFDDSIFYYYVKFNGTEFNGFYSNFKNVTFKNDSMFELSRFKDIVSFDNTKFEEHSSFHLTKFSTASFIDTKFKNIDLKDSDFNRIKFSNWSSIQNSLVFDDSTYLRLIRNFKDNGQFNDADDAYYEYYNNIRKMDGGLWNDIAWICGYGVKPWRIALYGIIGTLFLFILFYWLLGMSLKTAFECSFVVFFSGYNREFVDKEFGNNIQRIQDWLITSLKRLIIRDWIISDWLVKFYANLKKLITRDSLVKLLMASESILGWFVLGLFIVTLANKMIRL